MIDEILHKYHNWLVWLTEGRKKGTEERLTAAQTKTAIYEIGLGCIGADEDELNWNKKLKRTPEGNIYTQGRNQLKASQRKAWAAKCNIKESEQ